MYNQYLEIIDGHGISAASESESREGNLYLVPGIPQCYKFAFLPVQEDVGSQLEVVSYVLLSAGSHHSCI